MPQQRRPEKICASDLTVLQAVEQGILHGMRIIAATGLSMSGVYAALGRLRERGLIERTEKSVPGPQPDRHQLTDKGQLALEAVR